MAAFDEIARDLDWRESEMAMLRILLANDDINDREKLVLFRAGWALLYAHYEGFCKFALTVYFDALEASGAKCADLNEATQVFALSEKLKKIRSLAPLELLSAIRGFEADTFAKPVSFPEIDTESNLWPKTLARLLDDAGLEVEALRSHSRALATLVNRRNKIAHGEREMIPEYDYYIGFEHAVQEVMYELALAIDQKISGS